MIDKVMKGVKNPKRAWWYCYNKINEKQRRWQGDGTIKVRKYVDYDEYVEHQKSKLRGLDLKKYNERFEKELTQRLNYLNKGMSVLCLAAREGAEVKAFKNRGCFAIGLDLNPGKKNKYVLPGDFHELQFANESVDVVFTNSLDHVLNYEAFIKEVSRVLKPGGLFITDVNRGTEDAQGVSFGYYEANQWKSWKDVIGLFEQRGFIVTDCQDIKYPWIGKHVVMVKKNEFYEKNCSGEV